MQQKQKSISIALLLSKRGGIECFLWSSCWCLLFLFTFNYVRI